MLEKAIIIVVASSDRFLLFLKKIQSFKKRIQNRGIACMRGQARRGKARFSYFIFCNEMECFVCSIDKMDDGREYQYENCQGDNNAKESVEPSEQGYF